jgi:hypothetical protein
MAAELARLAAKSVFNPPIYTQPRRELASIREFGKRNRSSSHDRRVPQSQADRR